MCDLTPAAVQVLQPVQVFLLTHVCFPSPSIWCLSKMLAKEVITDVSPAQDDAYRS